MHIKKTHCIFQEVPSADKGTGSCVPGSCEGTGSCDQEDNQSHEKAKLDHDLIQVILWTVNENNIGAP